MRTNPLTKTSRGTLRWAAVAWALATFPSLIETVAVNRGRFWGLLLEPVRPVSGRRISRRQPWDRWR